MHACMYICMHNIICFCLLLGFFCGFFKVCIHLFWANCHYMLVLLVLFIGWMTCGWCFCFVMMFTFCFDLLFLFVVCCVCFCSCCCFASC